MSYNEPRVIDLSLKHQSFSKEEMNINSFKKSLWGVLCKKHEQNFFIYSMITKTIKLKNFKYFICKKTFVFLHECLSIFNPKKQWKPVDFA